MTESVRSLGNDSVLVEPLAAEPIAVVPVRPNLLRARLMNGLFLALGLLVLAAGAAIYFGGLSFNTVMSGSMRPGIQPGGLVILHRVSADTLRVGDVIAYLPPNSSSPIMHRIVSLSATDGSVVVQTQGDANNTLDPGPVRLDATAYRMAAYVPFLGWLVELRPWIWLAFAATLVLIALGWGRGVVVSRLHR